MSLVVAYSDSESEGDGENTTNTKSEISKTEIETEHSKPEENEEASFIEIEDEDEWEHSVATTTDQLVGESAKIFSSLPEPSMSTFSLNDEEEIEDEFLKKKPSKEDVLFKKEQALLEKELKDSKKDNSKGSKHFLSKFAMGGSKKAKKHVMISIPTLEEIGADSDSENEDQISKQPVPQVITGTRKSSALFSMLPKPKNSVTVGANKNRVFEREANRSLVPHTLTKKPTAKPTANATKSTNVKTKQNDEITAKLKKSADDSDEEDEDEVSCNSFFSLGKEKPVPIKSDSSQTTEKQLPIAATSKETSSSKVNSITDISTEDLSEIKKDIPLPVVKLQSNIGKPSKGTKDNSFFANLLKNKAVKQQHQQHTSSDRMEVKIDSKPDVSLPNKEKEDLPTSYGVSAPYGRNDSSNSYGTSNSIVTAPYGSGNSNVTAPYGSYGNPPQHSHGYPSQPPASTENFFSYSHDTTQNKHQHQLGQAQGMDYYSQPNEDTPIDQEAIVALQGRKRRRGEEINLIDVNAKDLQMDKDEYLKNMTLESGYKSKAPKDIGITGQQKKKHQITYLAFQAKEREFELRQSWADSRASKQQTQSKYGF